MNGSALTPLDRQRLHEALALAAEVVGSTDPNPRVGCVIGDAHGRVWGRGATQPPGQAHAEVMALRDAAAAGHAVRGATAWVTLEPCAHHGRTPPCCDALREAGVARVVAALGDPFPAVAGRGFERLRAAGVAIALPDPQQPEDAAIADAAWELNIGFFSRVLRGRPWLRTKVAASLDGRTALADGRSQWITGAAAREDGQHWRRRASAVMTGIGTVLADDPQLTVRLPGTARQPLRVVLDPRTRLPPTARLRQGGAAAPLLAVHAGPDDGTGPAADGSVEWIGCGGADGRIDLPRLLALLAGRGVNELHVEAGATLNGALLQAGLVDEWLLYVAPVLLGEGRGIAALPPLADLAGAPRLHRVELKPVGEDVRLRLRPAADLPWRPAAAR